MQADYYVTANRYWRLFRRELPQFWQEVWTQVIPEYRYSDFETFVAEMLTVKTKAGG